MLGPLLPSLMARWSLSDSEAGALFTAQFLLGVVSSVSVAVLIRRFRAWHLMTLGYFLCGFGALGLAAPYWQLGFLGTCLYGLGLGLANPTANLAAAALMPDRPATALNLLNFFFSIGATLAPPVIGVFVDRGISVWFPLAFAIPTLCGALLATRLFVADFESSAARIVEAQPRRPANRFLFAMVCMAMLFVYVGVEVSSGGWVSTYLQRVVGTNPVLAASAPAALWGSVLISRLLTVFVLRFASVAVVLLAGISMALAGCVWMLLVPSPQSVIAAIALTGLGLGPIFANTLGYFLDHYGKSADRITGLLFAAGGTGGALLPFVVGRLSDQTGNLSLALWTIPACTVLMYFLLAFAVQSRPDRNHAQSSRSASA